MTSSVAIASAGSLRVATPSDPHLGGGAAADGRWTMGGGRRVLVVDDEPQSQRALSVVLRGAGFEVDVTRTTTEALDRAALRVPAAAIIELELPDGDGVDVCRRLREWSAMPLILLSAVGEEEQQVRALEAGADDYLTKPIRPRELVARLRAHLRRAEPGGDEPRVELDGLEIDLAARVVRREGEEVHLTPIEFKLLAVLLRSRGRVLTHRALLQQVWGPAYVNDRPTLRAHIANLRRKIEPAEGLRLIRTDPGVGYRFADLLPGCAQPPRASLGISNPESSRSRPVASRDPGPAGWSLPTRRRASQTPLGRVA